MNKREFLVFLLIFSLSTISYSQDFYRMSADFTTKVKIANGKGSLTKGKVYYDKYNKELIYDITFPSKEKWVIQGSKMYKIINDSIYFNEEVSSINEFTVFHLALNSNLTYFGLNDAEYAISKVEKKGELVISYWHIPKQLHSLIGSVALARKGNSLHSIIISGTEDNIINKQFFKDYLLIDGFEFPKKIVQIYYDSEGNENYQIMEFKNITLNDSENEELYHYTMEAK